MNAHLLFSSFLVNWYLTVNVSKVSFFNLILCCVCTYIFYLNIMQIYYIHDILDDYGIAYGCELLSAGVRGGRGVGEGVLDFYDDVIKWKHFPRYWPFVWGIRRPFLSQRAVTRSFDVVFDLRLNKRLSKQLWGWWFETWSHSLWRDYYAFGWWNASCSVKNVAIINRYVWRVTAWKGQHIISWCL